MVKGFKLGIDDIVSLVTHLIPDDDVFWIREAEINRQIYVSSSYENVWGRSCSSLYEHPESWYSTIVPEDQPQLLKQMNQRFSSSESFTKCSIINFRIFRPNGSIRWIQDRCFSLFSKNNQRIAFAGIGRSLTKSAWEKGVSISHVEDKIGYLLSKLLHESDTQISPSFNEEQTILNDNTLTKLTEREKDCLNLLLLGKTAKESCRTLNISPRTVETHIYNIKSKLKCKSKLELISRFAKIDANNPEKSR